MSAKCRMHPCTGQLVRSGAPGQPSPRTGERSGRPADGRTPSCGIGRLVRVRAHAASRCGCRAHNVARGAAIRQRKRVSEATSRPAHVDVHAPGDRRSVRGRRDHRPAVPSPVRRGRLAVRLDARRAALLADVAGLGPFFTVGTGRGAGRGVAAGRRARGPDAIRCATGSPHVRRGARDGRRAGGGVDRVPGARARWSSRRRSPPSALHGVLPADARAALHWRPTRDRAVAAVAPRSAGHVAPSPDAAGPPRSARAGRRALLAPAGRGRAGAGRRSPSGCCGATWRRRWPARSGCWSPRGRPRPPGAAEVAARLLDHGAARRRRRRCAPRTARPAGPSGGARAACTTGSPAAGSAATACSRDRPLRLTAAPAGRGSPPAVTRRRLDCQNRPAGWRSRRRSRRPSRSVVVAAARPAAATGHAASSHPRSTPP